MLNHSCEHPPLVAAQEDSKSLKKYANRRIQEKLREI
jgi:hypothetical protein